MTDRLSIDTLAVRGGYHPADGDGISPKIDLSTTFHLAGDGSGGLNAAYSRSDVPAYQVFERAVADVEDADFALVLNSGTSAMVALLDELRAGDRLVFTQDAYHGFFMYARDTLATRGVSVDFIDFTNLELAERAIPGAALVWLETPTNPHLRVTDLRAVASICAAHGVRWVTDNTFSSPVLTRPIELGAWAVLESVTKYLGGHSDVLLGAVATNDAELFERMERRRARIGTQPDAFSCWLARRGMQTLALRVRRQSETALRIAQELRAHSQVTRVHYPGLPDDPGHEIAARQMCGGFGGMLSFVVAGGKGAANRLTELTKIWVPATSLGSVESLIERRSRWDGDDVVDPALLRLSAGIEDPDDLWTDLAQALEQV
jgi:cystathionine gamma-synthase